MRFSRSALYAVHFLAHLASSGDTAPVASHLAARELGIPDKFLRRALGLLARTGVLVSLTGPHGGFRLARPANAITLLEVVETIDGPLGGQGVPSLAADPAAEEKKLAALFEQVSEAARDRLRKVRLSDLAGTRKG